jgi:hypothetical protein
MGKESRGIGFSLFGNKHVYKTGVFENCHLAHRYYPGWQVYVYTDGTPDRNFLKLLLDIGAIVKQRSCESKWMDRSGRFFIAEEVDRFIIRDADSRIGHREALAVQEWVDSGKPFHFMHDHENHRPPIMGGMWGAVSASMPEGYIQALEQFNAMNWAIFQDQVFIKNFLWDNITHEDYLHHRSAGYESGHSVPFPSKMVGNEFVGDTYYRRNEVRGIVRVQEKLV